MANTEQLRLLGTLGVKAWNAWREQNPDVVPDLSDHNFIGDTFIDANLAGANIRNSHFFFVRLFGVNLSGAVLDGAILTGC